MAITTRAAEITDVNGLALQSWYTNQVFLYPPVIDTTVTAYPVNAETLDVYFYFQNSAIDADTDTVILSLTNRGKSVLYNAEFCYCETTKQTPAYSTNVDKTIYKISITHDMLYENEGQTDFRELLGSQLQVRLAVRRNKLKRHAVGASREPDVAVEYGTAWDTADELVTAYSKDNLVMSAFSDPAPIYVIMPPKMEVYGGLSAQDISSAAAFPKAISTNATNAALYYLYPPGEGTNIFYPETPDAYRIKGQLTFETGYDQLDINGVPQWQTIDYEENDYLTWYQIQIYKETNTSSECLEDSDRLYPDRNWDFYYKSFAYTFHTDFTSQIKIGEDKDGSGAVTLLVVYKTAKGYLGIEELSMLVRSGVNEAQLTKDKDIYFKEGSLQITPDSLRGVVHLTGFMLSDKPKPTLGYLVYQRADLRKTSPSWETIAKCDFEVRMGKGSALGETRFEFDDKTVEAGVPYKYRVRFYYKAYDQDSGQWSIQYANNELVDNNAFFLMSEDSFLMSKKNIFKIGYDASVSNLKRNIVDIVTPTLGGAYPFVRRNGEQKYHTFTIGGLISCAQENGDLPLDGILDVDSAIFNMDWFPKDTTANYLNAYERQKLYEKLYRQKIMDFLYEDQVVLFKSFQEGNMLVKLTDIALAPAEGSNRHLYTFSATATEIAESNAANYEKYFSDITEDLELSIVRYYIIGDYGYRAWRLNKEIIAGSTLQDGTLEFAGTWGEETFTQLICASASVGSAYTYSLEGGDMKLYWVPEQGWSTYNSTTQEYDKHPAPPDIVFTETIPNTVVTLLSAIANPVPIFGLATPSIDVEVHNYYDATITTEATDVTPKQTNLLQESTEMYDFKRPVLQLKNSGDEYITTVKHTTNDGTEITRTIKAALRPGDYPDFETDSFPAKWADGITALPEAYEDLQNKYKIASWLDVQMLGDGDDERVFGLTKYEYTDQQGQDNLLLMNRIPSTISFWINDVNDLDLSTASLDDLKKHYRYASWIDDQSSDRVIEALENLSSINGLQTCVLIGTDKANATIENCKDYMQFYFCWAANIGNVLTTLTSIEEIRAIYSFYGSQNQEDGTWTLYEISDELTISDLEQRSSSYLIGVLDKNKNVTVENVINHISPIMTSKFTKSESDAFTFISWLEPVKKAGGRIVSLAETANIEKIIQAPMPLAIDDIYRKVSDRVKPSTWGQGFTIDDFMAVTRYWIHDIYYWPVDITILRENYRFISYLANGERQYEEIATLTKAQLNEYKLQPGVLLIGTDNAAATIDMVKAYVQGQTKWATNGRLVIANPIPAVLSQYQSVSILWDTTYFKTPETVRITCPILNYNVQTRELTIWRQIYRTIGASDPYADYSIVTVTLESLASAHPIFIGADAQWPSLDLNNLTTEDKAMLLQLMSTYSPPSHYQCDGIAAIPDSLSVLQQEYSYVSYAENEQTKTRVYSPISEIDTINSLKEQDRVLLIGGVSALEEAQQYLTESLQYNTPVALLGEKRIYRLNMGEG